MSVRAGKLSIVSAPKLPETRRIAGIATTRELVAAGFSDRRIRTLARRGDLFQAGRGVYADGPKARDLLKLRDGQQLLRLAGAVAESPLESIARVAFRDCGLPPPELQVWLGGTTEPIGRVDFYWRTYRTIAEVDGALKYDGDDGPNRARQQLRRDMLLREDGFEVVHFTWDQVTGTHRE